MTSRWRAIVLATAVLAACSSAKDDESAPQPPEDAATTEPAPQSPPRTAAPAAATGDDDGGVTGATSPFGSIIDDTFTATFDGAPSSPQPWRPTNWDVTVHSRDRDTFDKLQAMQAMHGDDCGAPPATHTIDTYEQAVFLCRNHLMTSIKADGYGAIYLTPDVLVDFSHEATVRWDMSTARTSIRDWPDVWITPYDDNLQLPLEDFYPDLAGPPRRAIHVAATDINGATAFKVEVYDDFKATELDRLVYDGYESKLTPDAARRDAFELTFGNGRLRFGMPGYGLWWYDGALPRLDWDSGVVTFGHHSYNPEKDCGHCSANTWHWDNVKIAPAHPFTILRADRRYIRDGSPTSVSFPRPAPADAHVRFAGIGDDLEVSFDDGGSWKAAQTQRQVKKAAGESFASFWMTVPAGTTKISVRGKDWWGGPWLVRDITIWSPARPA